MGRNEGGEGRGMYRLSGAHVQKGLEGDESRAKVINVLTFLKSCKCAMSYNFVKVEITFIAYEFGLWTLSQLTVHLPIQKCLR